MKCKFTQFLITRLPWDSACNRVLCMRECVVRDAANLPNMVGNLMVVSQLGCLNFFFIIVEHTKIFIFVKIKCEKGKRKLNHSIIIIRNAPLLQCIIIMYFKIIIYIYEYCRFVPYVYIYRMQTNVISQLDKNVRKLRGCRRKISLHEYYAFIAIYLTQ